MARSLRAFLLLAEKHSPAALPGCNLTERAGAYF